MKKIPNPRGSGGFSILELMIALMLGLVVVAGIVQLFVGNSRTYDIISAQARLQENARFSFEFISDAARNAGYFGCAPEPQFVLKGLIGVEVQIPEYFVWRAIEGFDAVGNGSHVPDTIALPRSEGGADANVHISGNGVDRTGLDPNSDIVLFRSVQQPVAHLENFFQPQDLDLQLRTPGGDPEFQQNDVVLVADCQQAVMLRATASAVAGDVTTLTFDRVNTTNPFDNGVTFQAPSGDILPWSNSLLGIAYTNSATAGVVQTTIFYVAPSSVQNNQNQDVNALWRKIGRAAPVELVQGVENMQITYGFDRDGDNSVDAYRPFNSVGVNDVVQAIRVQLDISNPDVIAEAGDRLRRTYSKTISLRNLGA